MTAFAAMAASTALPPRSRICTPARAASGWLAATLRWWRFSNAGDDAHGRIFVGFVVGGFAGSGVALNPESQIPNLTLSDIVPP
jgi:hypothetical protein